MAPGDDTGSFRRHDRDLGALIRINQAIGQGDPEFARYHAALTHQVFDGRSALMAYRLHLPLGRGGVSVMVGALHLPGARGLLALLREQRYRVKRVY